MSSAPAAAAASSSSGGAGKLAAQKQLNANKRRALDAAAGDNDVDEDGQRAPPSSAKRQRGDEGADSGDANSVQLGQNKRIEVRSFKNMVLIDIREMYIVRTTVAHREGDASRKRGGLSLLLLAVIRLPLSIASQWLIAHWWAASLSDVVQ